MGGISNKNKMNLRIGRKCLAIDELLTCRNDNLILRYAVIGIVALDLTNRAEEENELRFVTPYIAFPS